MRRVIPILSVAGAIALAAVATVGPREAVSAAAQPASSTKPLDGQQVFRFDTFADEQLWTDVLRLHEVLPSVPPETAWQSV
jgi:hypothetical protein